MKSARGIGMGGFPLGFDNSELESAKPFGPFVVVVREGVVVVVVVVVVILVVAAILRSSNST